MKTYNHKRTDCIMKIGIFKMILFLFPLIIYMSIDITNN